MTFRSRNAYYLRISTNVVLPLFLYLDERHTDWMSDVILQHVLADLRPLVIPKLQAEKDVCFGPGAGPGTKRGTVEVRRGESYQFAYFFRKMEPHTVLFKSRYFVANSLPSVVSKSTSPRPADRNSRKTRPKAQVSVKQNKRKHGKTKGNGEVSQNRFDEDGWTANSEEDEEDMGDVEPIPRVSRPVRKQRRIITDIYQEDGGSDEEAALHNVVIQPPLPETEAGYSGDPSVVVHNDGNAPVWDTNDKPGRSPPDVVDIELAVEEEEKPKPFLKLRYQPFSISGRCLCVVVEPWPPQHAESKLQSASVTRGQRAEAPLFYPESDKIPTEREMTRPPVPLFLDEMSENSVHSDDDLMSFSQTLNAAGHMHAVTADDDDDIDGAILFGDADETRELL